jgi:hypothetical protein
MRHSKEVPMRRIVAVLVFAALGCGNNSKLNGGGSDMSALGGGGSGGAGGGGGSDMSAAATCDVVMQSGCGPGQKCIPAVDPNTGRVAGACVPNGTVAIGGACSTAGSTQTTFTDNCVAGAFCDNDGPNSTNTCRKVCSADSTCASTEKCGIILTRRWGICLPTCTLGGTDCPASNDCSVPFDDIFSSNTMSLGFFVCKKTGTSPAFANCNADTDCGGGLFCNFGNTSNFCSPTCDSQHACPTPPAVDGGPTSLTCTAYTNLTNGQGYCN